MCVACLATKHSKASLSFLLPPAPKRRMLHAPSMSNVQNLLTVQKLSRGLVLFSPLRSERSTSGDTDCLGAISFQAQNSALVSPSTQESPENLEAETYQVLSLKGRSWPSQGESHAQQGGVTS